MTFRPASEKQIALIARLVEEKDLNSVPHALALVEKAREAVMAGTFSSRFASEVIDMLFGCKRLPKVAAPALEPGIYTLGNDTVKVVPSRNHDGVYAKRLTLVEPVEGGDGQWGFAWDYEPGLISRMSGAVKMDAVAAAAFGQITGHCVFCSRLLTDERSITVGYGPVCAEHNGLPWGETAAVA